MIFMYIIINFKLYNTVLSVNGMHSLEGNELPLQCSLISCISNCCGKN